MKEESTPDSGSRRLRREFPEEAPEPAVEPVDAADPGEEHQEAVSVDERHAPLPRDPHGLVGPRTLLEPDFSNPRRGRFADQPDRLGRRRDDDEAVDPAPKRRETPDAREPLQLHPLGVDRDDVVPATLQLAEDHVPELLPRARGARERQPFLRHEIANEPGGHGWVTAHGSPFGPPDEAALPPSRGRALFHEEELRGSAEGGEPAAPRLPFGLPLDVEKDPVVGEVGFGEGVVGVIHLFVEPRVEVRPEDEVGLGFGEGREVVRPDRRALVQPEGDAEEPLDLLAHALDVLGVESPELDGGFAHGSILHDTVRRRERPFRPPRPYAFGPAGEGPASASPARAAMLG